MAASYSVPYTNALPFSLTEGKEVIVAGVVSHHANSFQINLVGYDRHNEVALHFNPRFSQNEVVRNHNSNGWGNEEKHGGFPFQKGVPFEVKIVVTHHGYQIFVNNNYFCDFHHRLPKESVRNVHIEGDISLHRVAFLDVVHNPHVPFRTPIHGGLYPGRTFVISGIPTGGSRFNVNFLCGGESMEHHDVALHFDARFNQNTVIRNHKSGGGWGTEEVHQPYFPFVPNVPFEIIVLVEPHAFKVAVNNQHFIEFNHRIHPIHRVSHLTVEGDVRLTQVKF